MSNFSKLINRVKELEEENLSLKMKLKENNKSEIKLRNIVLSLKQEINKLKNNNKYDNKVILKVY